MKTFPAHLHNAPFSLRSFVHAAIFLAMCLMASPAQAAVDAFIKFESLSPTEPVKGDSTDDVFRGQDGWFEISNFNFGVASPTTLGSATGGAGAGKITFNEFNIHKITDANSPAFFKNCAIGARYNTITIAIRKAGGADPGKVGAYLIFHYDTVFTTKIDWSGPGDQGPEESITFIYGKLAITHRTQKADGTIEKPGVTQGWNSIANTAFSPTTTAP
jgi:type VI secretion system secreted protein Hcp